MIYGDEDFDSELKKMIKTSSSNEAYRHSCYKECVKHAEEMSWHLYGVTPEALLERVRPREDPEVTEYRKANYEPTTKSAADKAINIVSKIFNPNLYSIRWKSESENASATKLKEFTLEYYPENNSIVNFAKEVLLRKMLADPNGVLAIKLEETPDKTFQEVSSPRAVIYGSSAIWNYDEDHYLIHLETREEKSRNGGNITWYFFEYYDKNDFLYFKAYVTSTGKLVIEELENYPHNFGEIPVWRLQGKSESLDNGEVMYKSFFDSAVPFWNLSIIHESDVLGAYINHIHPLRYELSEPCNYKHNGAIPCRAGYVITEDGNKSICPNCEGSGYKPMGPFGVYKISKEKLQEGDGPVGIDPVGYVNVPVDATKMLEERADRMRRQGMWAINMDVEDEVGEVQSGAAKVIDRSAQYDTLYNIGSVVFDVHLTNMFYFFNKYMFGVSDTSQNKDPEKNLPEINKPTQFDIASTAELVANYKVAKDSGLDPNFLQLKQIEIGTRDLTTNPDLKKFTNLLLDLDPLPGMSASDVSMNVSRFFIRQVDAVVHNNLKRFLERALDENKDFYEKTKSEQKKILEAYGDEMVKANKPVIDTQLLENYAKQSSKKQNAFA